MWSSKGALRRRLTARVALSVLTSLCIVVSGCGSGSPGSGRGEPLSEPQQALYDQAVNAGGDVRVFIGTTGKEELDGLAEFFNERYPDVTLDITSGTGDQIQENTAGGQLFIDWILSESGQRAAQDTFAHTARRQGFSEPVLDEDWWEEPKEAPIVDEATVVAKQEDLTTSFNGLFGGATQ